jgi:hypothetical protein
MDHRRGRMRDRDTHCTVSGIVVAAIWTPRFNGFSVALP